MLGEHGKELIRLLQAERIMYILKEVICYWVVLLLDIMPTHILVGPIAALLKVHGLQWTKNICLAQRKPYSFRKFIEKFLEKLSKHTSYFIIISKNICILKFFNNIFLDTSLPSRWYICISLSYTSLPSLIHKSPLRYIHFLCIRMS